jgi:NAD(P)-dependent dehydrogenase (short-subunit alcohol dehydrogenase family)
MAERIGVVTGATRGGGKAIALELGAAGWTVYVTGRSTRAAGSTEKLPGTIEDTATAVDGAGGRGIAVRCDHTSLEQIDALVSRVQSGDGRLDLLVNNAWGGYEGYEYKTFDRPFWEQPVHRWDQMFTAGVRATLLTSARLAPLFLRQSRGLIVNTIAWLHGDYMVNLYYDTAKGAIVRMSFGMAQELRPRGVSVVALAPGFMRTERVMAAHAAQPFERPWRGRESGLVLDDPELVPIGVGEHERRAPVLLLDGPRDLYAFPAKPPFLPHNVLRGEKESRVPLLRAGIRTQVETDLGTPRRDRDPMRPRRCDAETDLVFPELRRLLLVPHDDRDRFEREHVVGIWVGENKAVRGTTGVVRTPLSA